MAGHARRGDAHISRITHLESGKRPKFSKKRLERILGEFPAIHARVTSKGGNWGDVVKAVNEEFGAPWCATYVMVGLKF
jgi:hypothetical protein